MSIRSLEAKLVLFNFIQEFSISARSTQDVNLQRTHMDNLRIPARITALQSYSLNTRYVTNAVTIFSSYGLIERYQMYASRTKYIGGLQVHNPYTV
jgi:hypothetical protein